MSKRNFVTVALAALVILLSSGMADAQLAWLDPVTLLIPGVGDNADLTARVQGIANLWGVDFWVTYDPAIINLNTPITAGVCPVDDIPLANTADNVLGVGHYAASAFLSGACDCATTPDQAAAIFNFSRVAFGISPIDFALDDVAGPGISVLADNSVEICNETTPGCWQGADTDFPVELTSVTVE